MTVAVANININIHNFDYAIKRLNDVIAAMNNDVLSANSITTGNSGVTYAFTANNFAGNTGNIVTLTSNTANITTGNVVTLTSNTATITTGKITTLTSNTANITTGNVVTLTSNTATITTGNVVTLTSNSITSNVGVFTTGNVVTLTSNSITSNVGVFTTGNVVSLTSNTGNIVSLTSNTGNIVTLTSNTANITTGTINTGNVVTLTSNTANITTGTINTGNVVTLTSNTATITTGTINTGNIVSLTSNTITSNTAIIGTLAGTAATGSGASGTWDINVTGAASKLYASGNSSSTAMTFNWYGQPGQPTWIWGASDRVNHYVYNPAAFNVNNARYVNGFNVDQNLRTIDNPTFNSLWLNNNTYESTFIFTISTTSVTVIDSFLLNTYRSGEYIFDIKDNTSNNMVHTRLSVLQNNGTVYSTEYAQLISNNQIGSFTVTSTATHVLINYQTTASINTTIKARKLLLTI